LTNSSTENVSVKKNSQRPRRSVSRSGRAGFATVTVVLGAAAAIIFPGRATATDARAALSADSASATVVAAPVVSKASLLDSLFGRSRKLRARFVSPTQSASIPVLREVFGEEAISRPGVYSTTDESFGTFSLVTMRPFADKVGGRIGQYRIGIFPSERKSNGVNPSGFLEITPDNKNTLVSEHFKLADFLTKDQFTVWPKYLVLREPLLDKLELVIDELGLMGVQVNNMKVMSGFRTPQYNVQGVGAGGRANDSRHQYGDAADVYIVNGTRDWMSDLNGDGRVNTKDAQVLASAAERVEVKYPELIGGIGIYKATSAHGPFVHIDVRGYRARWSSL
jgi:uncharacterized protein YcbK (DUF882 family)